MYIFHRLGIAFMINNENIIILFPLCKTGFIDNSNDAVFPWRRNIQKWFKGKYIFASHVKRKGIHKSLYTNFIIVEIAIYKKEKIPLEHSIFVLNSLISMFFPEIFEQLGV